MAHTQEDSRIAISTPLGKDVLLLRGFSGKEAISQPFHFDLDLLSENDSFKFEDIVGKNVTLRIFDLDGSERYWNGFISRFSQGSRERQLTTYHAEMVPWLWFLTQTTDCRIFQNQKVPDIIQKVFEDLGFRDFEKRLYGAFNSREYCVQYRETDFNFVSRLMEEEGLYYYFRHEAHKHVLVLANEPVAHEPCPKQNEARYDSRGGMAYDDVVTSWRHEQAFRPGVWTQSDYNFETPSTSLTVSVAGSNPFEMYDYPGEHLVRSDGDRLARIRLQEQTVPCVVSRGASRCRHFNTGFRFKLNDHYRSNCNTEYLLTSLEHIASQPVGSAADAGREEEFSYQNRFECIPFSTPFRPARVTPHPVVQSCQTAVVVGPAGEEIYTDKYGRVKVQFHWDREGKRDEKSSCWMRVSQVHAGKGFGGIDTPRIGEEVIVGFLEGDPDKPIIIGRVYNGQNAPPGDLPKSGMVAGIKSNSTPGGGGNNAIMLDDTKGKEALNINAQHDMTTTVGHDRTATITNNDTLTVKVNRSKTVTVDETISVGGKKEETITGHNKLSVNGGREEIIAAGEKVTITGSRTEDVSGGEKITITGGRTEMVTGTEKITITGNRDETVTAGETVKITGATTHNITGPLEITATASIKLIVGGSSVTLLPGSIEISSPEIKVLGGTILAAAEGSHKIGGSSITVSGGSINSSASGTHEIAGGMVKIN